MSRREEFKTRMKEFKLYKDTTGKGYWEWKLSLPDNLKYTDESLYDLKGVYEAGLQPEFNQEDGLYHLGSRDPKTGRILKRNTHPTYWKALAEDAKMGYGVYWIGNNTYTSKKGDAPIKAFALGGTNEEDGKEDRQTSILTNTVKKALERGDILLVLKILKRGNKEDRKFYYPDNGSILSVLNIYDTPLLGDALSLLDALKYSVKGDWDNASLSYLDAASPLALFSKSKLNWKGWGAKKKYIPEYEAIEREAKKNGTWLKNADGTDFTGDPREWVVKRSKKFREAFGDKYLEGYTGMRSPYNPKELLDTYLSSRERAYTYTPNKQLVKKKGDTGIAKLVVPDTDTYTVDALGNDWLHLTDKSINPYNFTNTNLIVSSVLTPVISFKNIRDDGPFGMRDVAEDQFVAKSTTPRKSVLYNNGDFDLSNPDIFKATITPYIGYKLYNKANRENTQSYVIGGETGEIEVPDIYNTLTNEQKNRIVATGREYTLIDPFVLLTETGIHDYSNEINTYLDKDLLEFDAGYLPEVTIGPRSRFYIPLETYYPFISDYPYTGHSEIPYFVDWGGDDLGYNLVTNNCSDKTREALEYTFNKKINPFLFTTPGDVRDFAIELLNGIKVPTGYDYDVESDKFVKIAKPKKGMDKVLIPASIEQYKKFKDYVLNSYLIGGETDDRTDHPISATQNLDKVLSVADFTDRINHTDPNIGEYNPFYNAYDDTYGTVPLQEVTVTAPWTKLGRNNADARRGMHYVQQGLEDAAKVAAPIVAGAALPAIASTGALGTITDLASIATNPLDPLNYLPYEKYLGKYLGKYMFLKRPNSFTRGIGGEQGLQDLIESGLVRGNPIGTEMTARNFAKMYRRNRDHFRDIMDGTGREGISNRFYNRSLSKDDFEAIKKLAELFEDSLPQRKVGKITLIRGDVDPLSRYEDYDDYLRVLKLDRQTLRNATSLDDSGLPLAYFYDDGRNPLTKGHDYAKSIYGVRVNNASSYNPRIFEGHLHYSFPEAVSLSDPNVEVFKRGIFGITTKMNKNKLLK